MKSLWAPWRIQYIRHADTPGCIFCQKLKAKKDPQKVIIYRSKYNFVLLNRFPYNPGHLMIAPYLHKTTIEDLTEEEYTELFALAQKAIKIFKKIGAPGGFNLGINLGRCAGAGYEHVHLHIVPRYEGDTNFMPIIANTKVVVQALRESYNQLKKEFNKTIRDT